MNEYFCNIKNEFAPVFIASALEKITNGYNSIVFVFVGTDCNIGDSLAPLASSLLNIKNGNIYIYGSLNNTITAKEVPYINNFIKKAHPESFTVVIDAAVGNKEDIGMIKIQERGLKPGLGVNKDLPLMGDGTIIGIISEKNQFTNYNLGHTRLSEVYKMADIIAKALQIYVKEHFKPFNGQIKAE